MSPNPLDRKPWPMKWIVLAIVVAVGGYTFVSLKFRKVDRAYRPYEDMKNRANTGRLLAAGFQRVELDLHRPAVVTASANTSLPAPGGLPETLRTTLVQAPLLPNDILFARAAPQINAQAPYPIEFHCVAPDHQRQLGSVELYVHGDQIVITPNYERLSGGLQSRTTETAVTATVPAGALKPGNYRVTLVGERSSRAWMLDVK